MPIRNQATAEVEGKTVVLVYTPIEWLEKRGEIGLRANREARQKIFSKVWDM